MMNYLRPSECLPETETQVIVWGTSRGKKVWTIGVYEDGTVLRSKSKWWWYAECCGEYDNELDDCYISKGWYAVGDEFNHYLNFQVEYWAEVERP